MYLADTLSRAYPDDSVPPLSPQTEFCYAMEVLDLTEHLLISSKWLKKIQDATNVDVLKELILFG